MRNLSSPLFLIHISAIAAHHAQTFSRPLILSDHKICIHCKESKPLGDFYSTRNGCRDCYNKHRKHWPSTHRDVRRKARISSMYNVPYEYISDLFEFQGGTCAICSVQMYLEARDSNPDNKTSVVDHDHSSGKIRGLLCTNCNIMLGHAKDNQEVLYAAVRYLITKGTVPAHRDVLDEEADKDG